MPVLPNPDYLNHPKMRAAAAGIDDEARLAALGRFLPAFQRSYADWIRTGRPDYAARIGAGDEVLASVQADGVTVLALPEPQRATLRELAAPHVRALEARLGAHQGKPKFRDMNLALDAAADPGVYAAVQAGFEALDVFDVAAAYVGGPVRIKKLYVQLNNAWETGVRYGVIDDEGLPPLRSDYWHIDSDVWPSIKALIYLGDVGLDQGPMRYVAGSHRGLPDFETVVRKTNDTLRMPTQQFLALPEELRMHALFGPFLTGQEPAVDTLLARERALTGPGGSVVLFDNNGVHRGGFVRSGARHIVQCLFEAA